MASTGINTLSQMVIILFLSIHAALNFDTINNPVDDVTTATTIKQIFVHITAEKLLENVNTSIVNASTVPTVTTISTNIPNSTAANVILVGKFVTASVYYYNSTTSSDSSSSGLSGGTIAGIVIGILGLICCLAICGGCCDQEKVHFEPVKVLVTDRTF